MGGVNISRIRKDPKVRQSELVVAALGLFSVNGYEKTMITDIVSKAGVAKGTFYYYFPTKEAMIREIFSEYMSEAFNTLKNKLHAFTALHKLKLFIECFFITPPAHIKFLCDKLLDEKQFALLEIIWQEAQAKFSPLLSAIILQGNQERTINVTLVKETMPFFWVTLGCLWEFIDKDDPQVFNKKVTITTSIVEKILGIEENKLELAISCDQL
jgi:AcrR family transcriptional regulator